MGKVQASLVRSHLGERWWWGGVSDPWSCLEGPSDGNDLLSYYETGGVGVPTKEKVSFKRSAERT